MIQLRTSALTSVLLSASLAFLALPLLAADPAPVVRTPTPIVESVTVDIVNVEVMVIDSKGNRVRGLTKDDFELLQDGRPQRITNFFAVEGGALAPEPLPAGAPPAAEPRDTTAPRTWIVVYIDQQFLSPMNRNRAITGVEEFLRKNLGANTEAMIVTADRSFKIRRRFTDRLGDLVELLDQIAAESSFGTQRESERQSVFQEIQESGSYDRAENVARNYARNLRNDLDFSIGALNEALKTLAGLDGRKIMLHVSDGLPAQPGREVFDAIEKKYRTSFTYSSEFDRSMAWDSVVNNANSVGVTMYTLDAAGLTLEGMGAAEVGRQSGLSESLTVSRWNQQDTLKTLALGTGGLALLNKNDFVASLEEVSRDLGNYYSLGFPAPAGGSEKIRTIEVRVKKPSLEVRTRRGYSEKSAVQRVSEQVFSALYFPKNENPLGIAVTRGKTVDAGRGFYHVPIEIRIPIGKITLIPQGDQDAGRLHLYFAVLDSNGRQSDLSSATQDIQVPTARLAEAKKRDWIYETKLLMLPGAQRLAVAVRDDVSNQISILTTDVFVSVFSEPRAKR